MKGTQCVAYIGLAAIDRIATLSERSCTHLRHFALVPRLACGRRLRENCGSLHQGPSQELLLTPSTTPTRVAEDPFFEAPNGRLGNPSLLCGNENRKL